MTFELIIRLLISVIIILLSAVFITVATYKRKIKELEKRNEWLSNRVRTLNESNTQLYDLLNKETEWKIGEIERL